MTMQLLYVPSCHVALQDFLDHPENDYDRPCNSLILSFRVKVTGPQQRAHDDDAVYYRRKFSEPLAVMTRRHHYNLARDKLLRMLLTVRVSPLNRYNFDIVGYILDRVRSIASGLEHPLRTAPRMVVDIEAVVPHLSELSESDRYRFDDGPPIYLDGLNSCNYEDYIEDDEADEDDDKRVSFEMRVELVDRDDVNFVVLPHGNSLIRYNVRFTLPPTSYSNVPITISQTFSEGLFSMGQMLPEEMVRASIACRLNQLHVPQPHSDIAIGKILRGLSVAADGHRQALLDNSNFVMTVEIDINLVVPELLRVLESLIDQNRDLDYVEDIIDFPIELRFVAASEEAIKGLERVSVVEPLSCSICFEDDAIGSEATRLPCSHLFHEDCIVKWLRTSKFCPLCRFELGA